METDINDTEKVKVIVIQTGLEITTLIINSDTSVKALELCKGDQPIPVLMYGKDVGHLMDEAGELQVRVVADEALFVHSCGTTLLIENDADGNPVVQIGGSFQMPEVNEEIKNTIIISAFPGVGKTYVTENAENLVIIDSDSSKFSWSEPGVRNPEFPKNYIDHIIENCGKVDIIMVSSHDVVREALTEARLIYSLVYPDVNSKEEYIERYKGRGNDEKFISFIESNWNKFLDEIEAIVDQNVVKIKLEPGQFLKDSLLAAGLKI